MEVKLFFDVHNVRNKFDSFRNKVFDWVHVREWGYTRLSNYELFVEYVYARNPLGQDYAFDKSTCGV